MALDTAQRLPSPTHLLASKVNYITPATLKCNTRRSHHRERGTGTRPAQ